MGWSEKSKEIALNVAKRHKVNDVSDALIAMLKEAAIMGMEYELGLWLNRPGRNTENGHEKLECQEGQQQ